MELGFFRISGDEPEAINSPLGKKLRLTAVIGTVTLLAGAAGCAYLNRGGSESLATSTPDTPLEAPTTAFEPLPADINDDYQAPSIAEVPPPPPEFYAPVDTEPVPPPTTAPTTTTILQPTTTLPPTTTTTEPQNGCGGDNTLRINVNVADQGVAIDAQYGLDFVDSKGQKRNLDNSVKANPNDGYSKIVEINKGLQEQSSADGVKSFCVTGIPASTAWVYIEGYPQVENEAGKYVYATARTKKQPGSTSQASVRFPLICQEGSNAGETGTITIMLDGAYRDAAWSEHGYGVYDGDMNNGHDTNTLSGLLSGEWYTYQAQIRGGMAVKFEGENLIPVEPCSETKITIDKLSPQGIAHVVSPHHDLQRTYTYNSRLIG